MHIKRRGFYVDIFLCFGLPALIMILCQSVRSQTLSMWLNLFRRLYCSASPILNLRRSWMFNCHVRIISYFNTHRLLESHPAVYLSDILQPWAQSLQLLLHAVTLTCIHSKNRQISYISAERTPWRRTRRSSSVDEQGPIPSSIYTFLHRRFSDATGWNAYSCCWLWT